MKLAQVLIFAKDLARLHAFYRDAIGLPTLDPSIPGEVIYLDGGGAVLALHAVPAKYAAGITITDPPRPRADTPLKVIFQIDDVPAARARLAAAGAQMRDLVDLEGRLMFDCIDPEGNVFRIQNR